jgi:hypothetical protein
MRILARILPPSLVSTHNLRVDVIARLVHPGKRDRDQPDIAAMRYSVNRRKENARQEHRDREISQHGEKRGGIGSKDGDGSDQ